MGGGGGGKSKTSLSIAQEEWEDLDETRNMMIRSRSVGRDRTELDKVLNKQTKIIDDVMEGIMKENPNPTRADVVAPVILELKPNDTVVLGKYSGYMNDGGDSRDVGYSFRSKVVSVSKTGKTIVVTVTPQYKSNDNIKLTSGADGWLHAKAGSYNVFEINGQENDGFQKLIRDRLASEVSFREDTKRREIQKAKVAEDWTKMTAYELKELINTELEKRGKVARGLSTAKKPALIEYIIKVGIRERPAEK
jgi:hypothetical protein